MTQAPPVRRVRDPVAPAVIVAILFVIVGLAPRPATAAAPIYAALGDSYSSGVGTRNYDPASGSCQRSPLAYGPKVAAHFGYSLVFVACGGAKIADVVANQLSALDASTNVVTISIGGNDLGFTHVITQCAKPWPFTCWGDIDNAQAFIRDTLPARLDDLYSQIRSRAPNAKVVVVGYPRIFNGKDACNVAARISIGEEQRLNDTANQLGAATKTRALAHGFAFVDPIPSFVGHAVCDSPEWINGLSDPISDSYHPNASGQDGYTNLVVAALS